MLGNMSGNLQWPEGIPVEDNGMLWRFPLACILIAVLAFMRVQYSLRIVNNLRVYAVPRYMRLMVRDDLNIFHPYSILSLLLLCVSAAILTFELLKNTGWYAQVPLEYQYGDVVSILFIALVVGCIIVTRSFIYALVMWVLGTDAGQLENRYAHVIFSQVTGLVLTPLAVLSLFADDFYLRVWCYAGLGIFALTYLYRVGRGIISALSHQVSAIYIIYYLCTLEIVPAALVTGVLIRVA